MKGGIEVTDLEKWEKFLTEMGVLFKTDSKKDFDNVCEIEVKSYSCRC